MAKVKISTSYGDIVVCLYDETPIHRDKFTDGNDRPLEDIPMTVTLL